MATRQITCYQAVCDLCGTSETNDGYEPHAATEQALIDIVTEKWGDPKHGWTHTADGRLICDATDDEAHHAAHEEAGRYISSAAMTATFS
jgi:hypothetical protein